MCPICFFKQVSTSLQSYVPFSSIDGCVGVCASAVSFLIFEGLWWKFHMWMSWNVPVLYLFIARKMAKAVLSGYESTSVLIIVSYKNKPYFHDWHLYKDNLLFPQLTFSKWDLGLVSYVWSTKLYNGAKTCSGFF